MLYSDGAAASTAAQSCAGETPIDSQTAAHERDHQLPEAGRVGDRSEWAATRSWASVHRWGSGRVFQNFADPELAHWAAAYYGPNYPRLVRVKARYDPSNLFQSPQSLDQVTAMSGRHEQTGW